MIYYIIIICIIFYIYCYFVFPKNISILQSSLDEFNFNMLLKRHPLVIEDTVKDILSLLKLWFSPNIVQNINYDPKRLWNINSHKYLYVYSLENTEILIYPPTKKVVNDLPDNTEPIISIKLKKYQSLVIPYRWYYNINDIDKLKLYGIHDYITYLLDYII